SQGRDQRRRRCSPRAHAGNPTPGGRAPLPPPQAASSSSDHRRKGRTLPQARRPPESAATGSCGAAGSAPSPEKSEKGLERGSSCPGTGLCRHELRDRLAPRGGRGGRGISGPFPAFAKMPNKSSWEPGIANVSCPDPTLGCVNASCLGRALGCPNASSPEPLPSLLAVAVPVVYAVICAVGLVGNSAVLYVLLRTPRMKTVTNLFILNLAIADELFTLVLPINIADFLLRRWPFGELMCKVIVTIDQYNTFSSLYFLTVMSADRYLVVLATAESRPVAGRTYGAARAVSLAVWGFVTLVVLPFAVFAQLDDEQGRRQCVLVFPQPEAFWWRASRLYTLVLGFAIPVSSICVLYTTLLCRLRAMRLDSQAKALGRAKRRVTLLVVAILAVCLLCWTPYHLSTVVVLTTDLPQTPLVIAMSYFITSLSYANSCLNPFLYAFLDDSFRRSLRQLIVCGEAA
ncbi:PREDICTED: neuropeptides B/W receptor type 1, partial [Galeopterus variegatus]|uniref:Neuropeptides B/W receptor type 1 n=1 Tax=Galeopterus variegatus TaxID=482537 RepID=A0ABM0S3Z7_GALVR